MVQLMVDAKICTIELGEVKNLLLLDILCSLCHPIQILSGLRKVLAARGHKMSLPIKINSTFSAQHKLHLENDHLNVGGLNKLSVVLLASHRLSVFSLHLSVFSASPSIEWGGGAGCWVMYCTTSCLLNRVRWCTVCVEFTLFKLNTWEIVVA